MVRKILFFTVFVGLPSFGQDAAEMIHKFNLIQELVPNCTTVGVIWDPKSNPALEAVFGEVSSATGLRVVKTPLENIRDLSGLIRQMTQYNISFIYLHEDRLVSSKNVIKFVVKSTLDKKIPVFCQSEDVMTAGGYGELVNVGGSWKIRVNGNVKDQYDIAVPEGNDKFQVAFN
ncbi:MAG: hypothetical protein H6510_01935 [Acidobacteria bacterium]|nr:hypothetical protein [Acidobacteriota bacterium]MCB9396552.1 hypothetical protein [Acidobacteriota bacterium]